MSTGRLLDPARSGGPWRAVRCMLLVFLVATAAAACGHAERAEPATEVPEPEAAARGSEAVAEEPEAADRASENPARPVLSKAEQQQRAIAAMRRIADALSRMKSDRGRYPEELEELVRHGYIPEYEIDADDWGQPWLYLGDPYTYRLYSLGCDGMAGPAPPERWKGLPCEPDLIMLDGEFIQVPSGGAGLGL